MIYEFSLPGITCFNCVAPVEKQLRQIAALKQHDPSVSVTSFTDILEKRIYITVKDSTLPERSVRKILKKEIEDCGLECKTRRPFHLAKGIVGILSGAGIMAFCLLGGMALPALLLYGIAGFCTLLTLFLGFNTYRDAFKKLFQTKTLTMDALFTISSIAALGVSIASLFVPWLPMLFDAALLIFGFRHIGKAIEDTMKKKVMSGLTFRERTPKKIRKQIDETDIEVDVDQLEIGNTIKVRGGQIIPVDGECLDDNATLYDTIKTGNTLPKRIQAGTRVFAGMKVADDMREMRIKVTATEENSYLAKLDKAIQQARMDQHKAPIEIKANRYLSYFIYGLLALSLLSGIAVYFLFTAALAINVSLLMLSLACPCTLGFIIPLTLKIGLNKAANLGVHFKNGESLQLAGSVDTVFFDLNGTLTTGEFEVANMTVTDMTEDKALAIVDALETHSQHPIALALKKYSQSRKKQLISYVASEPDVSHHAGLRAKINGVQYTIGSKKMMEHHQIKMGRFSFTSQENSANQIIYLAQGEKVVAQFTLHAPLRSDAHLVIKKLQALGKKLGRKIRITLLTGADEVIANYYSKQLGIDYVANCSAQQKANIIQAKKKSGKHPVMIGDSGNDSVSMSRCFGIAIKSNGSDSMTEDNAGVVIEGSSLTPVVTALTVASQTIANIKRSFIITFAYNSAALLATSGVLIAIRIISSPAVIAALTTFVLNPAVGVVLMIAQMALVLSMAYYFSRKKLPSFHTGHLDVKEQAFNTKSVTRQLDKDNTQVKQPEAHPEKIAITETQPAPPSRSSSPFYIFTKENTEPQTESPRSKELSSLEPSFYC
jgi:Cu2+-exporting ATPase